VIALEARSKALNPATEKTSMTYQVIEHVSSMQRKPLTSVTSIEEGFAYLTSLVQARGLDVICAERDTDHDAADFFAAKGMVSFLASIEGAR
jgi:hypothetical protein